MDSISIGSFELHASERLLTQAGKPIDIGARAFDLLRVLAEHPGKLVTKATLLDRVWPNLVVDENNLPAQIASLRRILGATAIRTVPGFGYRLELTVAGTTQAGSSALEGISSNAHRSITTPQRWPERLLPLIGRDDDVQRVQHALSHANLVTVVGSAGVGKSRLAQEILALETQAAVGWVALESIRDISHVPSAIALAFGWSLPDGVHGFVALQQIIQDERVMVILDGAEHLIDHLAEPIRELVAHTSSVRVLVTSQAPLGVAGEVVYRLDALAVPEPNLSMEEAANYPSVALFAQRAAAADRRFELNSSNASLVAAVCRRLDGNPLALELAAARIPALGVSGLYEHLADRFRLLRLGHRNQDPRRNALHAAFEWSYSLLSAKEQSVFCRLGAFYGSFSLETASRYLADSTTDVYEAVDLIARLVDRSLVTALPQDPPRYMLLETAKYFARERLTATGQLEAACGRMANTMLQLLDGAYADYWSVEEQLWLQRYASELDNVRAALDWAIDHDRALGVALYGASWPLFVETELFSEARARYEQTVKLITSSMPRLRLGRFWEAVATYDSTRQWDRARYAAELAAEMYADTGDLRARYYTLMLLALNWRDDPTAAQKVFRQAKALEKTNWPTRLLTQGTLTEGALLLSTGRIADARDAYQNAVRLALSISERQGLAASIRIVELDLACGDIAAALQLGRPLSLSLRASGRRASCIELSLALFSALLLAGDLSEARIAAAELFDCARRLDPGKLYSALDAMAYLACAEQRYRTAARITCCADIAYEAHGQARRRQIDERMRTGVVSSLDNQLGSHWRVQFKNLLIDESEACSLALGFDN